jgi:hypothetical protein
VTAAAMKIQPSGFRGTRAATRAPIVANEKNATTSATNSDVDVF